MKEPINNSDSLPVCMFSRTYQRENVKKNGPTKFLITILQERINKQYRSDESGKVNTDNISREKLKKNIDVSRCKTMFFVFFKV